MTPEDPRHGKTAGYCAGCRDECCRTAAADYARRRRTRHYLGGPLRVDALGTKRRIRALMALGWTSVQIDAELGRERTYTANLLCGHERVLLSTAQRVAEVYDRLSMQLPENAPDARKQVISRTRNESRRKGWLPPLAWDDIDDPHEHPDLGASDDDDVDPVVVERILAGDTRLPATTAERIEVVTRWRESGRPLRKLEILTGWNATRYYDALGRAQQEVA